MSKIIEPDSAVDWMTVRQLAESAAGELLEAAPNDPLSRRLDLYREVKVKGRLVFVRIKLTIVFAAQA